MNSVSNNVLTEKSGFEAVKRGCGAFGEVGKIGGQVVDWLQGGQLRLKRIWENSACFTKPGAKDTEVNFQGNKNNANGKPFSRLCRSVFAIKTSATRTSQSPERKTES